MINSPNFPDNHKAGLFKNSPFGEDWDKPVMHILPFEEGERQSPKYNQWTYHLETGIDGAELINRYLADQWVSPAYGSSSDNKVDLSIYYETDDVYNSFGTVCFIKINEAFSAVLSGSAYGKRWREYTIEQIVETESKSGLRLNRKKLEEALEYEIQAGNWGMTAAMKIAVILLGKLAARIRAMRLEAQSWDADRKDYAPLFSLGLLNAMVEKWKAFKKVSDSVIQELKNAGEWCDDHIPGGGRVIKNALEIVTGLAETIINAVDRNMQRLAQANHLVKLANAFICGMLNAAFELAAGIVDLAALLLTLSDKAERQKLEERLENMLEDLRKTPEKIIDWISEKFDAFLSRYGGNNSGWQIAYHLGEDILDILALMQLVAGLVKGLKKVPKAFKALEEFAETTIKKAERLKAINLQEEMKALRFKYIKRPYIQLKWKVWIQQEVMRTQRVKELALLRTGKLAGANIAIMRVRVILKNGEVLELKYWANSGIKNNLKDGVNLSPELKNQLKAAEQVYFDYKYKRGRKFDSENKMLLQMDADLQALEFTALEIEIESTFMPCNICKREILIRREKYGAKIKVISPKFRNRVGLKRNVKTGQQFKRMTKQIK